MLKITTFYHFDTIPRFPPFLLYVRWISGVTFVWRCFRDVQPQEIALDLGRRVSVHLCNENRGADQLRANWSSGFPTRSDTNRAVQLQKMARGLKFHI